MLGQAESYAVQNFAGDYTILLGPREFIEHTIGASLEDARLEVIANIAQGNSDQSRQELAGYLAPYRELLEGK